MIHVVRRISKPVIFAASLAPLVLMLREASANPNQIYFNGIIRVTGFWSLRFLCLTLAITPLRWLTGWHSLVKFRRMMGLFGFFYAAVHTIAYFAFDPAAVAHTLSAIGSDLLRPFFAIGIVALVLIIPLAATSTADMIRRLGGRRWQALHRLAYPATIASVLHTYWPLTGRLPRYALILSIIFVLRAGRAYARSRSCGMLAPSSAASGGNVRKASVCIFLLFAAIGGLFAQQQTATVPDEIFFNGKVITVDSRSSIQEAFAVRGDTFLAIGSNAAMRALAGPQTKMTDLGGHAVIPGLMDNHIHPWRAVFGNLKGIDLTGVHSGAEIGDRIRQGAGTRPGRNLYATGRWSETDLSEKRAPTRAELDQIMPARPLMVLQGRGKAYLNSAALKAAGITRDTKAVYGEPLPKDANGEPTGVLTNAWAIMTVGANLIPIEDIRELWLQTQQELNAQGFTSLREPMVPNPIMRMYSNLRRESKLTLRMAMGLDVGAQQADELDDILSPLGAGPTFGDHWLRMDSIGEYAIDGNTSTNPTPEMFRRGVMTMHRYGWRPGPHTTSDKALDTVLETYEAADRVRPIGKERWVVEHVPMVRTDQLDRLAKLGVVVSAQFQPYRGFENMVKAYGDERARHAVPMREILDHHLIVNAGSDWGGGPVTNPFIPIYFYVTRRTETGTVLDPAQKISREEALRVSTVNTAYLTFEEDVKGSIEAGKLADFLILSQDILTVPEEQIRSIQPLATYVGGRKVFSR